MTPDQFIATWSQNSLSEKGGAQPHFEDLCRLLGVPPPRQSGEYCYEQGLKKTVGANGFADVWKRGCFAWENKGPDKDLLPALLQLKNYAGALDNPPVLVVCNRERIEIHPCFTGYPSTPRIIELADIGRPENLKALKCLFSEADIHQLRPLKSNAAITAEAATEFAAVAQAMRTRGIDSQRVAHFLIQCIFCMYAEDEGLLHRGATDDPKIFTNLLKGARDDADKAARRLAALFEAMQKRNGHYGNDDIAWFNGGLFKTIDIPPLTLQDLAALRTAAETLDWRSIEPVIFGTLFERGLNPQARAPLGAHYTDTATIGKIIHPLITEPLNAEWQAALRVMEVGQGKGKRSDAYKAAVAAYQGFLERLRNFRVLDPACGSGNFLYMAMRALKDLEHKAQIEAELMGFGRQLNIETGPRNVLGLEINEYAAELARVTVWIGDLQWSQANGRPIADNPILRSLDTIEHRDALLNPDGNEAAWPAADVVVGNPPFLGGSRKRSELGDAYFDALNKVYADHVPGGADLVCYWFHKARLQMMAGQLQAAGLVATQAVRAGSNRKVLDAIVTDTRIFEAWSDEAWINEGAAVRVSLVGFGSFFAQQCPCRLNGEVVEKIHADLTAEDGLDMTKAQSLGENLGVAFKGAEKSGAFELSGELAREWLKLPNPNGQPNSHVLKPWVNGQDIAKRPSDTWIIDFGTDISEADASFFEQPFEHVLQHVKPERAKNNDRGRRENWWRFGRNGADMRLACSGLSRVIITPRVAKHRYFVWLHGLASPDSRLYIIARADDTTFGILSSRMHEAWSLANASMHGDGDEGGRPTYNGKSCFENFPFPPGMTPRDTAAGAPAGLRAQAIAEAARELDRLRNNWLNSPDWVDWVSTPEEDAAGFPKRPVAKPGFEAQLKKRTLTNLYNEYPSWLRLRHEALDRAVAAAYGWTDYTPGMPDDDILRRLLALNLDRTGTSDAASPEPDFHDTQHFH